MAAYISVPRDLTRVKTKILFNLTKRQLICFSIGALIGVPCFFGLRVMGSNSLATLGMVFVMMPFFFLAMYEKNGQPLEVVITHMIQVLFIRPKLRPYKTNNYYAALMRQYQTTQEVDAIVYQRKEAYAPKRRRAAPSKKPVKKRKRTGKKDHRKRTKK